MYQDSGLFLREGPPSGFAGRRVARRLEQGVAPPRAWRSAAGSVLRLAPQRLAEMAERVKEVAPPAHPAAADPEAAVLDRVSLLARAARPAGTVSDPATGRRLHLFRAPGRWGAWELVTAPPRGALFDIVGVRPARMEGEMEVYQRGAVGWQDASTGLRVRGPHAVVTWSRFSIAQLAQVLPNVPPASYLYVLTYQPQNLPEVPRYVGETGDLRQRWAPRLEILRLFDANTNGFFLWVGTVAANPNQVHLANANGNASPDTLIRKDVEHVLIRTINGELPAGVLARRMAGQQLTAQAVAQVLLNLNAFPTQQDLVAAGPAIALFVQQNANAAPLAAAQWQNLLAQLSGHLAPVFRVPLLANQHSTAPGLADPHQQTIQQGGGISLTNQVAQGANLQLPWFLSAQIQVNPNVQFEIPDLDAPASAGP